MPTHMTDDEKYSRLDFIASLVKPWNDLHQLLLKPYSLDPKFSDPIITSRAIAIATSHQWDYDKHEKGKGLSDKCLRDECPAAMRLKDLCNTIKHVSRKPGSSSARLTDICAQFIVNDEGKFSFLRNRINYYHEHEGEFDFMNDARKTISFWARRRGINIVELQNWHEGGLSIQAQAPHDSITLILNPNICIY